MRRQKSYSAGSGYVYQYFYLGQREADSSEGLSSEYVFEVSADRKTSFEVSVCLPESIVAAWCAERGRELAGNERYAVAKMALFDAFDQREDPDSLRRKVLVSAPLLEQVAETLEF